jgi:hypothetical protein
MQVLHGGRHIIVAHELGDLEEVQSFAQHVRAKSVASTMVVDRDNGKAYLVTSKYGLNYGNVSEELRYRPTPIPGTFSVLVVSR